MQRWKISSQAWPSRIAGTWCLSNRWNAPGFRYLCRIFRNETRRLAWDENNAASQNLKDERRRPKRNNPRFEVATFPTCQRTAAAYISAEEVMKKIIFSMLPLAVSGSLLLSGCASHTHYGGTAEPVTTTTTTRTVIVSQAPPAPRAEIEGPAPSTTQVWVKGNWVYNDGHWVWMPGHWEERPRVGAVWVPGHWDTNPEGKGWVWTPGYWQ